MPVSAPEGLSGELDALARRLRLPYLRQAADDVLATAKAQRWHPGEVLKALLEEEVAGRERSMVEERRKKAQFPAGKTFDAWDPARSSIPAATEGALRTLEWVGRHENLVVCGPSGTGKSHLLEALGQRAVDEKLTVRWFSIEDLGVLVRRHRIDDSVGKALVPVLRADVIVVDDIGLLSVSEDAAEGFYRLVDAAYEKRSLAVSSNLHPSGFDQLMGKSIATALVDRLLHHAHVVETSGESIRLQDATNGKGVTPLV
jgi:DNA replication protein DnaC